MRRLLGWGNLMWSDHGCQALVLCKCAASCEKSCERRILCFAIRAGVKREALVEKSLSVLDPRGLEVLHDAPAGRQIDDRAVSQRVIKLAQLEKDPIDARDVVEIRVGFLEELDGVVVALAKAEPAPMTLGLGRIVAGLVSHGRR